MKTRNLLTVSIILFLMLIVIALNVNAQNIGINSTGATPNSSAMLDIDVSAMAAKKGLLIPRVALTGTADVTTISSPAISLLIYNTATAGVSPNNVVPGYYFYNGSNWIKLATQTDTDWSTIGNVGTDPTINFIGTLDNNDLVFKTYNIEVMRATASGRVGINESNPNSSLQVKTYANGIIANPFDGLKIQSPLNTNYNRGTLLGIEDGSISGVMGQNAQLWNFEPGFLRFGTQDIERMRIDKNGLFGFNEQNPVSTFTIRPYNNGAGAAYDGIRIIHPSFASNATNGLLLGVDITGSNASLTYYQIGDLNISVNAGNMNFATNGFDRMKITSFGQVTIGNTNPLATLTIQDNVGVQPGLMVTNTLLVPGTAGLLFGLDQGIQTNGKIWNYMSGDIEVGTNNSEIIRLSSNGKVGIGISVPLEKLHVVGNARISSLAGGTRLVQADVNGTLVALLEGTSSQVLLGDGTWGTVPGSDNNWMITGNSGINSAINFIGTTDDNDVVFKRNTDEGFRITTGGALWVSGKTTTGITPTSGAGRRMMWIPAKGAFRVGEAVGNEWNDANIGLNSFASGIGTNASGAYSTAIGYYTTATNTASTAMGSGGTTASGLNSIAIGQAAIASGNSSTAIGSGPIASGTGSTAFGSGTIASGARSTAIGRFTTASGNHSTAMGNYTSTGGFAGSFILGDSLTTLMTSTVANQFMARFKGGYVFSTDATITPSQTIVFNNGSVGIGKTSPNFKVDLLRNTAVSHDRALNIEFNSSAVTTTAPMHSDSSAALFIRTRGTSTGDVYSGYFNTTSNSTGNSAGLLNFVSGASTGTKLGIGEMIFGNGDKAGYTAHVSGTGTSHYGINLDISGATENYGLKAIVDGSGTTGYGLYITGSPKYSAFFDQGVFYSKNNGYFGYTSGTYDLNYMLDVNGKSNFTNALSFNGSAGTLGYILKSNGAASAPSWTDPALLGFLWDMDVNGDIYNNNTGGKVDVTGSDPKNITNTFSNYFRVKSNDIIDPLVLQIGLKTDINPSSRYGAIEVDDGGTIRDLILQPNSGNVGIGTITPAATLHVVGNVRISSLTGNRIVKTDASGTLTTYAAGAASQVLLGTGVWGSVPGGGNNWSSIGNSGTTPGTGAGQNFLGTIGAADFVIATNTTERVRITSSGDIGIGTSTPIHQLEIKTPAGLTPNDGIGIYNPTYVLADLGQGALNEGALSLYANGVRTVFIEAAAQSFIDAGFFGLGTSSPNARLEVSAGGGTNDLLMLSSNDGLNGNMFIVKNSGNVGIGITTPAEKLHVVGNIRISSLAGTGTRMVQTDANGTVVPMTAGTASQVLLGTGVWGSVPGAGNDWSLTGNAGTTAGTNFIGTTDAQDFVIKTGVGGIERMRILSTGNVGIGTTTPTEKLNVTQTADANKNVIYGYANQTSSVTDYQNAGVTGFGQGNGVFGASGYGFGIGVKGTGSVNSYGAIGVYASLGISVPIINLGNYYCAVYADASTTVGITKYAGVFLNGNVGIGTAAPTYQFQLSTDGAAKPSTNTWTVASDARLKKDISSFTDGLDVILQINPVKYKYNGLAGMPTENENIGILAQDMQKIAPYTVGKFKYIDSNSNDRNSPKQETEYLSFNSHALTFVTINAIKEQQKQIEDLKAIVSEQQKQINQLLNH